VVPAIVTQVAHQTAQDERGVASAQYTRTFDVHAGPANRHDHMIFTAVYSNGDLVHVHITSDTLGGKNATASQRAQTESAYEHPKSTDLFRAPWDPRYTSEYNYRIVDPTTIAFTSLVTDTAHGSGTFTIDEQNHVTAYQYKMSANYEYVTSGTVSGERAQVLPGYWAVAHEVQHYTGKYGPVPGGATTDITQASFRRFASVSDAQGSSGQR
jgi:hypothetical protein